MEFSKLERYRLRKTSVDVNLVLQFVGYVHCAVLDFTGLFYSNRAVVCLPFNVVFGIVDTSVLVELSVFV